MFISKVTLTSLKEALAGSPRLSVINTIYHQHQMLWTLFPDTPKGSMTLLFRQEYDKPLGFIVVSEKAPTPCAGWEIQTKPYQPTFKHGDVLTFKLTANPVVTKKDPEKPNPKSRVRHDLVMDWIHVHKAEEKDHPLLNPSPDRDAIARLVGLAWIQAKGQKHGFEIVRSEAEFDGQKAQVNITGYTQHRFEVQLQQRGGAGASVSEKTSPSQEEKAIRLSTLDFDGVLRVTDPDLFQKIILQGLGPAKGFGCGLMLVRRLG
jgi:CRISPR system Cascade subunit CasE